MIHGFFRLCRRAEILFANREQPSSQTFPRSYHLLSLVSSRISHAINISVLYLFIPSVYAFFHIGYEILHDHSMYEASNSVEI